MDIKSLLNKVKESTKIKKTVDFEEQDLHFELEILSVGEESILAKRCQDLEGFEYFNLLKIGTLSYSIKKLNDAVFEAPTIEVTEGEKKRQMPTNEYLEQEIREWPDALINTLYDAYSSLHEEHLDKIDKGAKYERFEKVDESFSKELESKKKSSELKEVKEDSSVGKTEVEKLQEKVNKELEEAQKDIDVKRTEVNG